MKKNEPFKIEDPNPSKVWYVVEWVTSSTRKKILCCVPELTYSCMYRGRLSSRVLASGSQKHCERAYKEAKHKRRA